MTSASPRFSFLGEKARTSRELVDEADQVVGLFQYLIEALALFFLQGAQTPGDKDFWRAPKST